ncbi:MAG: amidohydrolase family protein [Methanomicrobiales archaeon]|nr:amidohydrolase family protein [Methanomicrobiales archaeon]
MRGEKTVEGQVLLGEELEIRPARLVLRDGRIAAVEELLYAPDLWILPALFNAHTHLGDTVALDLPLSGSLEDAVTPPHGLKHRILAETPRGTLVAGMRATLSTMERGGTGGCADFREGGPDGVAALREAAEGCSLRPVILGREGGERAGDGIGISSTRDVPDLERQVADTRRAGKLVAFHAGERDPEDVEAALSFQPDLLVHCTHATRSQIRRIADAGIPVAVCARANWRLGVAKDSDHPPLALMAASGCTLLLGTDNVMVAQPDLWREMEFAATVSGLPPRQVLAAAIAGARVSGESPFLATDRPARLVVVDPGRSNLMFSRDPAATLVTRVSQGDIRETFLFSPRE